MNVLIEDSHPLYIEGLKLVINQIDPACRIFTAVNLQQGLICLNRTDLCIDLYIACINTVSLDSDAQHQLQTLCSCNKKMTIVAILACIDTRQTKMLLEMGVKGVMPKIYSVDKMILAFKECCCGQKHISAEVQKKIHRLEVFDLNRSRVTHRLHLTRRQLQVLEMIDEKYSNNEIASKLSVSLATVKTHINKLFSALGVRKRNQCIKRAYEMGILYNIDIKSVHVS